MRKSRFTIFVFFWLAIVSCNQKSTKAIPRPRSPEEISNFQKSGKRLLILDSDGRPVEHVVVRGYAFSGPDSVKGETDAEGFFACSVQFTSLMMSRNSVRLTASSEGQADAPLIQFPLVLCWPVSSQGAMMDDRMASGEIIIDIGIKKVTGDIRLGKTEKNEATVFNSEIAFNEDGKAAYKYEHARGMDLLSIRLKSNYVCDDFMISLPSPIEPATGGLVFPVFHPERYTSRVSLKLKR